jgi:hypothetical protein
MGKERMTQGMRRLGDEEGRDGEGGIFGEAGFSLRKMN